MMKGDFSRRTFDKKKHYSSVLMQQGRVQVDSDWNEQQAIHQYRHETQTCDAIGRCGAPKPEHGGGFEITPTPDGSDIKISSGRIYVDGILCENDRDDATLSKQDDLPMKAGDLAGFTLPSAAGRYLVYLDVWQRHITAIDDPDIREKALGGPDTATRAKTVWQVKLHPVDRDAECNTLDSAWKPDATGSGKLSAQTDSTGTDTGPCVLPPTAGFSRLENQLYRVEVHRGTDPNDSTVKPTFKWSRDNGSVVTSITHVNGQKLTVKDTGRDEVLGFACDQWVEILDDRMELADQRGHIVQIDTVNHATCEIKIKSTTPLPDVDETRHPKLRRWDQSGTTATAEGVEITTDGRLLEGDIEVWFSDGTYRSGDYWLIPARTAISPETGSIECPLDADNQPIPQLPHDIHHHYCPLALVDFYGSRFKPVPNSDCRQISPPLTDITADDVRFDNNTCQLPNVETVQDALNDLCQRHEDGCTLIAVPGSGWEAIFDRIADGQDARVCFRVGEYLLDEPIMLAEKGHLKISGCGAGTRIIAPNAETVFKFEDCKSVVVQDLYAESSVIGSGQDEQLKHLNGTLTFSACPKVTVENVELKCGAGAERAASCISVRDSAEYDRDIEGSAVEPVASVRIRNCDLHIGHQQVGILLVNVLRAQVEDNMLQVSKKPKSLSISALLQNRVHRSAVRSLMIREPVLGKSVSDDAALSSDTVIISAGEGVVRFKTDPSLVGAWEGWIEYDPPKGIQNDRDLLRHLTKIADRVLLDQGVLRAGDREFRRFESWYKKLRDANPAVGSQGIAVGGRIVNDIRILNNKILGVLQGIHVGVSHRVTYIKIKISNVPKPDAGIHGAHDHGSNVPKPDAGIHGAPGHIFVPIKDGTYACDMAGTVHIMGNSIGVLLPPGARERHGIFVGNCDSLIVQNNYARVRRFSVTSQVSIDGIHIYGHLGRMMIVRQNHLVGTTVGIRVVPLSGAEHGTPQWIVTDNVAPNARNAVLAPSSVRGIADNYA